MKAWLIVLIGLAASWHYMDIASDSVFKSGFLPFIFVIFFISFVVKIAVKLGPGSGRGGDGGSWFDGPGDGGGSCD